MAFWKPGKRAPDSNIDRSTDHTAVYNSNPHLPLAEQRRLLPIYKQRTQLLYLVENYQVVVLVGHTGAGKTTQVPQYLLEAGWSRIACTQPRRISATLVASRVADEKESAVGDVVGYAAGFDRRSSAATQITYVTDEFLVRETSLDPMLSKYNVIMIDEAHERSLFTDVLAGLVKKVLKKRPELRIIVSSATTQADSFHSFFNTNTSFDKSKDNAVIVTIPGRMFPVDIYYTDEAVSDYIEGAVDAVFNIHKEGRSGDILVFVTGREQAQSVVSVINMRASDKRLEPIYAVPLYSGLSNDEQMKVFDTPIPGTRKVVVATTIAEASITIDGIVFVVDCGFAKTKYFDPITGIERLLTLPISQSSAIQRAGRAGRTRPGKVLRLYTESSYNAMNVTDIPEICRTNLSSVIMLLKGIGIENILTFSFLDTPSHQAMAQALELLYSLGCLDENGKLTSPLGEAVARFPLDPKLAVMLMNSKRFRCSDEALTIVAMLSNIFSSSSNSKLLSQAKGRFAVHEGDHITYINIFDAFVKSGKSSRFCNNQFLSQSTLNRAVALRKQLARLLQQFGFDQFESCKTDLDSLLKCIVSGFFSQAAKLGPDGSYTNVRNGEILAIHPDSVLFKSAPQWVVYHQVLETTSSFMSSILAIEPEWLTELAYWRLIQATLLYDEILNSRDHLGIAADVRVSLHLREPRITVNDFPIFLY